MKCLRSHAEAFLREPSQLRTEHAKKAVDLSDSVAMAPDALSAGLQSRPIALGCGCSDADRTLDLFGDSELWDAQQIQPPQLLEITKRHGHLTGELIDAEAQLLHLDALSECIGYLAFEKIVQQLQLLQLHAVAQCQRQLPRKLVLGQVELFQLGEVANLLRHQ
eukprot:850723-Prymnesium_polylepis.1